jgi:ADP-ribose pyrophosphatase YjhB (NUDIX family)
MRIANPVDLFVINNKNQILLCKRAEIEQGYKGTWSIPGGGPETNEGFEEAIHREIKEELGCRIKWFKYFKSYSMVLEKDFIARSVYFYGGISGKIKLNKELSEYKALHIKSD